MLTETQAVTREDRMYIYQCRLNKVSANPSLANSAPHYEKRNVETCVETWDPRQGEMGEGS